MIMRQMHMWEKKIHRKFNRVSFPNSEISKTNTSFGGHGKFDTAEFSRIRETWFRISYTRQLISYLFVGFRWRWNQKGVEFFQGVKKWMLQLYLLA